jgi:hypothetical protein
MRGSLRYTDIEALRESINIEVERLDEGLFDRFRNFLSKKLGGDVSKADRILAMYSQAKESNLTEIGKIRAGVMAANDKAQKDPKAAANAKDLAARSQEAIARINKASADKLAAADKQFQMLLKGKSDRLRTYVDAKKAEIDWVSAQKELEAAKKYASPEEIERLKADAESEGKIAKNYQDKMNIDAKGGSEQDKEDFDIKSEKEKLAKRRQDAQDMANSNSTK